MSLILDALNRADNERANEQSTPKIQAAPIYDEIPSKSYVRSLLQLTVITALVAYVLYLQFFKISTDLPIAIKQTSSTITITNPHTAIENDKAPTPQAAIQTDTLTKQASPAVNELYQQSSSVTPTPSQPLTHQTTSITAEENKPAIRDRHIEQYSSTPLLTELSFKLQKNIPSIDYSQHIFSEEGDSFVEINDQQFNAGDSINSQLRLISIHPEYSILSYQGTRFKLTALNSWVNFNQ